jgi:uncharacterized protein (DUF1697 family)
MPRFVALLRGVNVGKGNRLPMADFKVVLEGLGYTHIGTILNGGNAVFTSSGRSQQKHAASIAAALQQELAVTTPVIVKSAATLSAVIGASPIDPPQADHSRYLVAFAATADDLRALQPLQDLARAPECFVVTKVAAFLHCPTGVLKSQVGEALLGSAGKRVTTRNWATVMKLHAQVNASVA